MPDVEFARRVWEHFKNIVFRATWLGANLKEPALAPNALPFCLAFAEIVSRHGQGFGFAGAGGQARRNIDWCRLSGENTESALLRSM
jgi:hypothetical protein